MPIKDFDFFGITQLNTDIPDLVTSYMTIVRLSRPIAGSAKISVPNLPIRTIPLTIPRL